MSSNANNSEQQQEFFVQKDSEHAEKVSSVKGSVKNRLQSSSQQVGATGNFFVPVGGAFDAQRLSQHRIDLGAFAVPAAGGSLLNNNQLIGGSGVLVHDVGAGVGAFEDDISAEIEARLQPFLRRRAPLLRRQIIRVPGPAGRVQQLVRRLPTPEPDVIERVIVQKPQRDVLNVLIERPATPPPQFQQRTVVAAPKRPLISQQIVSVPPQVLLQQQQLRGVAYQYAQPQLSYSYAAAAVPYGGYDNSYSQSVLYGGGAAAAAPSYGYYYQQPQQQQAAYYSQSVAYPAYGGAANWQQQYYPAYNNGATLSYQW